MSDAYDTLFTPAPYAFSIWGLIFFGLAINAGYQLVLAFRTDPSSHLEGLGPWLILTNLANGLWVFVWLSEWTAVSVVVLASMFVFLQIAMHRLRMETWDAPLATITLLWWPIVIYAGWVTVAVLANLSAYLAKEDLVSGTSVTWAVAMIAFATVVNLLLLWRRNLREHALVAVWAFVAIAVRQWGAQPVVAWTAVVMAGALGALVAAHAYRNRETLAFVGNPGES